VAGRGSTLGLCAAAALFEGFDNQSIGVAAPRLALEFALTANEKGLILSAAPFALFVGAAVGGRAGDFLGLRRALIVSMLLFGLCSLLTAVAVGADSLLAARLLTGLGLGGALPAFIALSSDAAPARGRLRTVTAVMAGMPLGGAIAALIALGEGIGWGWRSIFLVGGAGPLLIALVMWRVLPGSREAKSRGVTARVDSISATLFAAGRARTTLCLWTAFFFTQLILLLMLNWLPTLIVGLGFSHQQASWTSIWFNLCGSLGAMFLARQHAGSRRRLWVVLTYLGMVLALFAVPAFDKVFLLAALACGLAGGLIVGAQLLLFALAPLYYEHSSRGTGVGAAVSAGRFGAVVGPLFASVLLAGGGTSEMVLLGIIPFVIIGGGAALSLTWREGVSTTIEGIDDEKNPG
jgi:MFS transporter, AAHS family, 3-hydroxyphenylpropionic acid transporter